jgi:hypothetical protein
MFGLQQNDLTVQYIDFPYNYTIGEPVPWANELEREPVMDLGDVDLPTEMESEEI